mgnify:CR=1 FL=1
MDTDEFARTVDQNWHALGSPWSLRHFPNGGGSATAKGLRQHPEPDQWPAWTARHGSACMSGILTSTQASGSAVTGHLCPKTDVVASKWIAIATITSNLPFDEWTEVFGSERLTGAILDRLTHHVHILEMNGESYRLNQSRKRKA